MNDLDVEILAAEHARRGPDRDAVSLHRVLHSIHAVNLDRYCTLVCRASDVVVFSVSIVGRFPCTISRLLQSF